MTDIKELEDGELEKVNGGFTPIVDDTQPFIYENNVYKWIINTGDLMRLDYCYWACRLDEDGNPTGIIIQIPHGTVVKYLK